MECEITILEAVKKAWCEIFKQPGELNLDIGADDGRFVSSMAKMLPNQNFLAVEIDGRRVKKAVRRISSEGLENVKVIKADAFDVLPLLFSSESVRRVFLNHPDPWSKNKQWKNRLINPFVFSEIHRVLTDNGEFFITSDVVERIEEAKQLADFLEIFKYEFRESPPDWYPKTRYREESEIAGRQSLFLKMTILKMTKNNRS